jgi:hypothetical protein
MLKKCVICGAVFDAQGNAKTCGDACRDKKNKAYIRAYDRARKQTPERKAYERAYKQTPEYKAYERAYKQTASRTARLLAMAATADALRIGVTKLTEANNVQ